MAGRWQRQGTAGEPPDAAPRSYASSFSSSKADDFAAAQVLAFAAGKKLQPLTPCGAQGGLGPPPSPLGLLQGVEFVDRNDAWIGCLGLPLLFPRHGSAPLGRPIRCRISTAWAVLQPEHPVFPGKERGKGSEKTFPPLAPTRINWIRVACFI